MHNYYGMVIRNNLDDIHNIRKVLVLCCIIIWILKISIIDIACIQIMKIAGEVSTRQNKWNKEILIYNKDSS